MRVRGAHSEPEPERNEDAAGSVEVEAAVEAEVEAAPNAEPKTATEAATEAEVVVGADAGREEESGGGGRRDRRKFSGPHHIHETFTHDGGGGLRHKAHVHLTS